jgi:hypothetical protein
VAGGNQQRSYYRRALHSVCGMDGQPGMQLHQGTPNRVHGPGATQRQKCPRKNA